MVGLNPKDDPAMAMERLCETPVVVFGWRFGLYENTRYLEGLGRDVENRCIERMCFLLVWKKDLSFCFSSSADHECTLTRSLRDVGQKADSLLLDLSQTRFAQVAVFTQSQGDCIWASHAKWSVQWMYKRLSYRLSHKFPV